MDLNVIAQEIREILNKRRDDIKLSFDLPLPLKLKDLMFLKIVLFSVKTAPPSPKQLSGLVGKKLVVAISENIKDDLLLILEPKL